MASGVATFTRRIFFAAELSLPVGAGLFPFGGYFRAYVPLHRRHDNEAKNLAELFGNICFSGDCLGVGKMGAITLTPTPIVAGFLHLQNQKMKSPSSSFFALALSLPQ